MQRQIACPFFSKAVRSPCNQKGHDLGYPHRYCGAREN